MALDIKKSQTPFFFGGILLLGTKRDSFYFIKIQIPEDIFCTLIEYSFLHHSFLLSS